MPDQRFTARHAPQLSINLDGVISRLHALAQFRPCDPCTPEIGGAITDILLLILEVNRLYAALGRERLRSADLEAAIRAALGAEADGEADPLAYLRDEFPGYRDASGGWG